MQDWPFKELVVWMFLTILYYAFAVNVGERGMVNFHDFMFGDFIALWNLHFAHRVPSWTNPFVLMLAALFLWRFKLFGVIALTRQICSVVAAIFLVRVAVYVFGLYPVELNVSYALIGSGCFLWYMATSYLVDINLNTKLNALIERLRTD